MVAAAVLTSRPKMGGSGGESKALPKLELEGKKWMIEHFVGNKNIQVRKF